MPEASTSRRNCISPQVPWFCVRDSAWVMRLACSCTSLVDSPPRRPTADHVLRQPTDRPHPSPLGGVDLLGEGGHRLLQGLQRRVEGAAGLELLAQGRAATFEFGDQRAGGSRPQSVAGEQAREDDCDREEQPHNRDGDHAGTVPEGYDIFVCDLDCTSCP